MPPSTCSRGRRPPPARRRSHRVAGPFDEEEPWGSERSSRGASGASTTPGSRWRTAPGWPRACGCPTTPRPTRCRRSSSTCRTARATRWPAARAIPYFAGHGYAAVRVDLRGTATPTDPPRRVHAPGGGRRARGPRVARGAALVHRARRHVRHLVGRFQRPAGRRAPAAGAAGRHLDVRERRPLRRRRPLHRRLRARARHAPVGRDDADAARPAAGPGQGRRRLARARGSPDGTNAGVRRAVARTPAPRRYWRHGSVCEDDARSRPWSTRSAAGPTARRTRSAPVAARPAAQGPRRAVVARVPQDGEPGPAMGSSRSACAGGTTGSRTPTRGSWTPGLGGIGSSMIPVVGVLEPVVPPAQALLEEPHRRAGLAVLREHVRPRPDEALARAGQAGEEARSAFE